LTEEEQDRLDEMKATQGRRTHKRVEGEATIKRQIPELTETELFLL
jgi:hypothetical protein